MSEDKIRRKEPIIEPPPNLPFVRRAPPIDAVFSFEIGISMYCSNEKLPIFISASFLFHQYLYKHKINEKLTKFFQLLFVNKIRLWNV